MSNDSKESKRALKYVITSLELTCFKAFQYIQQFQFSNTKRNLVILASNCFGKTSTVDGFEYILSKDGTVERIGEKEDKMLNKAGPVALKNAFSTCENFPSSVSAEIEVYDEELDEKVADFLIERFVGVSDESKSEMYTNFLNSITVSPIIRGEESNAFVNALYPYQRFEKIAIWSQRKPLLVARDEVRKVISLSPATIESIETETENISTELGKITNQRIKEWGEPSILGFINEELFPPCQLKLSMSELTRTDPAYLELKELAKTSVNLSLTEGNNVKQQNENTLRNTQEIIDQLLTLSDQYSRIKLSKKNTLDTLGKATSDAELLIKQLVSEMQREIDQLHDLMNEYFQHITGNMDNEIFVHLDIDKSTQEGLIHLTTKFTQDLSDAQPTGFFSNAEKHAFTLAFQLAYIQVFNQGTKILILDDLVTSIDAGYRNRIVSLIFEKFADFQIIATTHDDLFNLSMYASADPRKWTFCRIIRVDPDHGPVFDIFRPTREQMQYLWDHGQSALTLLRQQMEHDFEQLIVDLRIKMRVLKPAMFDSYSLNEKINAVRGFFKEIGLVVPKMEGVEKETLEYFAGAKYLNKGIHDRDKTHSVISTEDEKGLVEQYYTFLSWFKCGKCEHDRFRRIKGGKETEMVCQNCASKFEF